MFLSESWRERRKQHLNTLCKSLQRDLYEHRIAPCLPLPHKAAVSEPGTWDPCPPWPPSFPEITSGRYKEAAALLFKGSPTWENISVKIYFLYIYMCSGIYMCTSPLSVCMYTNIQFNLWFLMWMRLFRYKWLSAVWVEEFGGRVHDILFKKRICMDRQPKWNYT